MGLNRLRQRLRLLVIRNQAGTKFFRVPIGPSKPQKGNPIQKVTFAQSFKPFDVWSNKK